MARVSNHDAGTIILRDARRRAPQDEASKCDSLRILWGDIFRKTHMDQDYLVNQVVQRLSEVAARTGEVTFDQLNALLPSDQTAPEQIEQVLSRLPSKVFVLSMIPTGAIRSRTYFQNCGASLVVTWRGSSQHSSPSSRGVLATTASAETGKAKAEAIRSCLPLHSLCGPHRRLFTLDYLWPNAGNRANLEITRFPPPFP